MADHNLRKHHRRSIRLPDYDYTQTGAYFVTIVTHERESLFDNPTIRRVVETYWARIPDQVRHVKLDEWVVMPNHLHGIIWIVDDNRRGEAFAQSSRSIGTNAASDITAGNVSMPNASPLQPGSLGAIIGNFKAITTRRINQIRKTAGLPVWQRNYYEHVIRHDKELNAIRQYIIDNPAKWIEDTENPDRRVWGNVLPK